MPEFASTPAAQGPLSRLKDQNDRLYGLLDNLENILSPILMEQNTGLDNPGVTPLHAFDGDVYYHATLLDRLQYITARVVIL